MSGIEEQNVSNHRTDMYTEERSVRVGGPDWTRLTLGTSVLKRVKVSSSNKILALSFSLILPLFHFYLAPENQHEKNYCNISHCSLSNYKEQHIDVAREQIHTREKRKDTEHRNIKQIDDMKERTFFLDLPPAKAAASFCSLVFCCTLGPYTSHHSTSHEHQWNRKEKKTRLSLP